jgi:glycerol-3-phosphate dehydrogenase
MNRATANSTYDLVVIGGGINGAAIARDAALRGLRVALFEKEDFGSGASAKSSKLAHGGVRYLEQLRFSLVRESLQERARLFHNAPHLVRPLPFLFPVYNGDPHWLWSVRAGLFLYDCMGGRCGMPWSRSVSCEEINTLVSKIKTDGLKGGCCYFDGQMLDNRILIETIVSAENAGAAIANYTPVKTVIYDKAGSVKGVAVIDPVTKERKIVLGKIVVNATGAWPPLNDPGGQVVQSIQPKPTKGVHLVVPNRYGDVALLLRTPQDGRIFFMIPWEGNMLVGTTDTVFKGNPDDVKVEQEDQKYLLAAVNAYFPDNKLDQHDIIASFAGLRPLADNGGGSPSEWGREHVIADSGKGLLTVLGGKYTTHRLIAEQVVDKIAMQLGGASPCSTAELPLPGAQGPGSFDDVRRQLLGKGFATETAEHLVNTYGKRALQVAAYVEADPAQGERFCDLHPHIEAELTFAVQKEHVRTLADWFFRRTTIGYGRCEGKACLEKVTACLAKLLA